MVLVRGHSSERQKQNGREQKSIAGEKSHDGRECNILPHEIRRVCDVFFSNRVGGRRKNIQL
jgi:hypothetical protein